MSQAADAQARPAVLPSKGQAGADPYSIPLEKIDVSDAELFETDTHWGYFERLRKEAPVHFCAESDYGPYWSVTRFDDIVRVEKDPETFSSHRNITINETNPDFPISPGFIAMDGAQHLAHRTVCQPTVAPRNLALLEPLIRERAREILDHLPVAETFNWVERVSIELTTAMLATLFDFPQEQKDKLTYWSDIATTSPGQTGMVHVTEEQRRAALLDCLETFQRLWKAREGRTGADRLDLVTALANADATRHLTPMDYLGTLILLIVGGNDTTRNSITGGVLALNEYPAEYEKLRRNPGVIPNMVSEMIRWQTPLAHMRRSATRDAEIAGQKISAGDKVIMWYVSANRDETAIDRANEFLIDRRNPKHHLSFGWGVHFCVGSRLAEMQLRVLWEEILERFDRVEVVGEPVRVRSCFVKGFSQLPVRVQPR